MVVNKWYYISIECLLCHTRGVEVCLVNCLLLVIVERGGELRPPRPGEEEIYEDVGLEHCQV
jgi:hypothetical protein